MISRTTIRTQVPSPVQRPWINPKDPITNHLVNHIVHLDSDCSAEDSSLPMLPASSVFLTDEQQESVFFSLANSSRKEKLIVPEPIKAISSYVNSQTSQMHSNYVSAIVVTSEKQIEQIFKPGERYVGKDIKHFITLDKDGYRSFPIKVTQGVISKL